MSTATLAAPSSPKTEGVAQEFEHELVQVFKLLADETRFKIVLFLLREGELHVSALCERLRQSQPAVSHHLGLLRGADLIRPRRDGKHNFYSLRSLRLRGVLSRLVDGIPGEIIPA